VSSLPGAGKKKRILYLFPIRFTRKSAEAQVACTGLIQQNSFVEGRKIMALVLEEVVVKDQLMHLLHQLEFDKYRSFSPMRRDGTNRLRQ
jgi:hypothetical protein